LYPSYTSVLFISNDFHRPLILISHDIERRAVSLRQLSLLWQQRWWRRARN